MNNKKKLLIGMSLILGLFVLSGCGIQKKDQKKNQQQTQQSEQISLNENEQEEVVSEDKIEFSDPGNDNIGQEVKELDSLINQTAPSEYSESELSVDSIEAEVEQQ